MPEGNPVTFFTGRSPAGPSWKQMEGIPRRRTADVSPTQRPESQQLVSTYTVVPLVESCIRWGLSCPVPITIPSFSSMVMFAMTFLARVYASSHDPASIQEELYVNRLARHKRPYELRMHLHADKVGKGRRQQARPSYCKRASRLRKMVPLKGSKRSNHTSIYINAVIGTCIWVCRLTEGAYLDLESKVTAEM